MFSIPRLIISIFAAAFLIQTASADEPIRVLFLGDDGHHQPATRFAELQPALVDRGIAMTYTDDVTSLSTETLNQYDALALYANIDTIDPMHADALLKYVADGGGFVPLHCATFCFRNSQELVSLMGAQFQRHGTGVFRSEVADVDSEVVRGYHGFESWDETYVHHRHNPVDRTVLEYRVDDEGREPWTWIRTHGDGRVFYTAWGHDSRTWTHPGFVNLVERGIRWAAGGDPTEAGRFPQRSAFESPAMTSIPAGLKPLEYEDVGAEIPNYTPSDQWGVQGKPLNLMQTPIEPEQSLQHIVTPTDFHVELFVSEPQLGGKPICMAWDERGRLWVAESYDYPNELQPPGKGRDRIRICEDTDADGRADKFTVFAEELSIPTSIAFSRGGVIVQNGTETLYLKDTDGDDRADERTVMVRNWTLGDTHGGVSNFQYGLDNWLWAMQGYNDSQPVLTNTPDAGPAQRFRMGFFRMRPDGSEIEFVRSTNNNTWGLGISEEGLIFGSTANGNPSIYMPIPNRYYESVNGWATSLTLSSIADSNRFEPITDKVRQVDHHGGYTAAAGHALYTAREYPQDYWNRVAFVNGPTGHLVGGFVLSRQGSDFHSTSPFNLFASDDEWTAPIMAEIGPDGHVWVIDWYNYIVQHNPTPEGFDTGKGRAYETKLRDKTHGRIYRVVANDSTGKPVPDLSQAGPSELVVALADPTMLVRKHAQRLLVERGNPDVLIDLIGLIDDTSTDAIGLNVGAIHALWTLHGLGLLDASHEEASRAAVRALRHPSAGVRRNAIEVLPPTAQSTDALVSAGCHRDSDALVRLAAMLALADLPSTDAGSRAILQTISDPIQMADRWIPDAATSAAAHNSVRFLRSLADADDLTPSGLQIVVLVANHFARSTDHANAPALLAGLAEAKTPTIDAVIAGLTQGWRDDSQATLESDTEAQLEALLDRVSPESRGTLVTLATVWGSQRFEKYGSEIIESLLVKVRDEDASEENRIEAARQLIVFAAADNEAAELLLDEVSPRTAPSLATGIMTAVGESRAAEVGGLIVERLSSMTPRTKKVAMAQLLRRPAWTQTLLSAAKDGKTSIADLDLDQKQALATHPDREIRDAAVKLLQQGGSLPSADRKQVLDEYFVATTRTGNVDRGKAIFKEQCSKCHMHSGEGMTVGPDLTGMAVHPKSELLTHILDPSRSVEGNFRAYSVLTADGVILTGMLASESKTSIELFDTTGKKISVLRDDIEQLNMSVNSIMPAGFEKSIPVDAMADLLEFLTTRGKFLTIDIAPAATIASDRGMFQSVDSPVEQLVFADWSTKTFAGVPFMLVDPRNSSVKNVILLKGPAGKISREMPTSASVKLGGPAKSIHLLSGVAGWGFPYGVVDGVVMTVRLHYADGQTEDHELRNGEHFADYIRRVDVPGSEFAFDLDGRQIRYLSIAPKRSDVIDVIEFRKGENDSAPIVMAVTVES